MAYFKTQEAKESFGEVYDPSDSTAVAYFYLKWATFENLKKIDAITQIFRNRSSLSIA